MQFFQFVEMELDVILTSDEWGENAMLRRHGNNYPDLTSFCRCHCFTNPCLPDANALGILANGEQQVYASANDPGCILNLYSHSLLKPLFPNFALF